MQLALSIEAARRAVAARGSACIGLVPTMGNLHKGHLALVRACREACGVCVVSIFVNPTQFGANEDFSRYPRTLEADLKLLEEAGADIVFKPSAEDMYPQGQQDHATVSVPGLSGILCGASRPGHFDAVATVVAKLFNIVRPQRAFFGEKDWQQLVIVRTMARQLDMGVEVVGVPTVREESGLALSSRNGYLDDGERAKAAVLYQTLAQIKEAAVAGRDPLLTAAEWLSRLIVDGYKPLLKAGFAVDYLEARDASSLAEPDNTTRRFRLLAAVQLGKTRLIDNVGVDL